MISNNAGEYWNRFVDQTALDKMNTNLENGITEGSLKFNMIGNDYIGVYKYQADWDYFLIRAERNSDISNNTRRIYLYISIIILSLTIVFVILGFIIINREF